MTKQTDNAVPVRLGEGLTNQRLNYFSEVRDAPPADPEVYERQSLTDSD